jgi:hypothetical protein
MNFLKMPYDARTLNTDDITNQIRNLPRSTVTEIASAALGVDVLQGVHDWTVNPLDVLSVGSGTLGLWKVAGKYSNGTSSSRWSAIVKAVDPDSKDFLAGFNHAWRELETLRSGQLSRFDTGLQTPPVYGITDRTDGTSWIWMKDLSDSVQPPWSTGSFLSAARHIGMFNGHWPESNKPDGTWVSTDGSTDRRTTAPELYRAANTSLASLSDHPDVIRATEGTGLNRVLKIYDDLLTMIEATNKFPRSVAHNDIHARNVFPVDDGTTIAIDWASVGLSPTGVDGGGLAGASITWGQDEADLIEQIEPQIFDEYVSGLRESGWDGDVESVRLVYLSTFTSYVALLVGILMQVVTDAPRAEQNLRRLNTTRDHAFGQIARRFTQFVPFINEGLALAT